MANQSTCEIVMTPLIKDENKTVDKSTSTEYNQLHVSHSTSYLCLNSKLNIKPLLQLISCILVLLLLILTIFPILLNKPVSPEHSETIHKTLKIINSLDILPISQNFTV